MATAGSTIAGLASDEIILAEPHFDDIEERNTSSIIAFAGTTQTSAEVAFNLIRWQQSLQYLYTTPAERYAVWKHWIGTMGGLRPRWVPSWVSDFRTVSQTYSGNAYIDVVSNGFENYLAIMEDLTDATYTNDPLENYWGLLIRDQDLDTHYRAIDSYTPEVTPGVSRIAFADFSGKEIPAGVTSVNLISLVRRCRVASDSVNWSHEVPVKGAVTIPWIEVLYEATFE